ncbi:Zinc finger containing protein [Pseudozyma hubeiensis]|nr:Zinc finger containing protein [Pseudozyma hubeiensis]
MGCAICLDDFDQKDGESKRAATLPCGHIFHHDCLQTWFYGSTAAATHRPTYQKRCPLCTQPANPENVVKLYPSDGDDLDTYLSGQQQWEMVDPRGGAVNLTPQFKRLLDDLVDFNTAMQRYVMGLHGCDLDKTRRNGGRVQKLVVDLTKDRDVDITNALTTSMEALERAAANFVAMSSSLHRDCKKNRKLQAELVAEQHRVTLMKGEAEHISRASAAKSAEAEAVMAAANERMSRARELEASVTDKILATQVKEDELNKREQELEARVRQSALQTTIRIANINMTTDAALKQMQSEVGEAGRKKADAERERAATHKKNCELAEQLKKLQQQLKDRKKAPVAGPSTAMVGEGEGIARRLKALEARNKSMEEQLKAAGISTPEHRISRNSRRPNAEIIEVRSSSPLANGVDSAPITPMDGFELLSQVSASASTAAAARVSPTAHRKGKKRARSSLSVEPERLDDEMDEGNFPMPGFGVLPGTSATRATKARPSNGEPDLLFDFVPQRKRGNCPLALRLPPQTSASSSSERKSPARKTAFNETADTNDENNSKKRKTFDRDGSSSSVSGKPSASKKPEYDWLNKKALSLGPKRRHKA